MGITLSIGWAEPYDMYNPSDMEAAETEQEFGSGWILHPLVYNGVYPPLMRKNVDENSKLQGFNESRLPVFTEEERKRINGELDLSFCDCQ